jgi:hypothetical protein
MRFPGRRQESCRVIKNDLQRRGVSLQQNVRNRDLALQVRPRAFVARVLIGSDVVPGPAVEPPVLDGGGRFERRVVAALVDHAPRKASRTARSKKLGNTDRDQGRARTLLSSCTWVASVIARSLRQYRRQKPTRHASGALGSQAAIAAMSIAYQRKAKRDRSATCKVPSTSKSPGVI